MDSDFVSTRYGLLRVAHFVLCFLCLIMGEVTNCWSRNYGFLDSVAVYGLLFSILILVMFCVQLHPGIGVLVNLCPGAAKLGGILTGILGIITGVTFGASARLSYDWFATGSQALTI